MKMRNAMSMLCTVCVLPLLITLLTVDAVNETKLKGAVVVVEPFVFEPKRNGYSIDLLDKIAEIVNFTYTLDFRKDVYKHENIIGDVGSGKYDFAIGDITITDERKRSVSFTEPFMELDLSALLRKDIVGDLKSFTDLTNQTKINVGTIHGGTTSQFIRSNPKNDPVLRKLAVMDTFMIHNRGEGIEKARKENFALIQESVNNEYAMDLYCELTVIPSDDYPRQYAIALQRNSKLTGRMSDAINNLKANGFLNHLKRKYFNQNCLSSAFGLQVNVFSVFICLIISELFKL